MSNHNNSLNKKYRLQQVVLIQLKAHETHANDEARMFTKLEFFKALHKQGWSSKTIRNMYRFLDIMLCLNEEFDIEYEIAARKIDEVQRMQIMSNIEQKAYYKGIQQGEQRGELRGEQRGEQRGEVKILVNLLTLKFKSITPKYLSKIEHANTTDLEKWASNCLTADTIEDIFFL